ncbi:MAG: proteasome activator, partial [Acidimicrobiales bacterium]
MEPSQTPQAGADGPAGATEAVRREMVQHPAKLLRIGGMIRETLEEVRRAHLDQEGRRRAREIYE